MVVLEIHVTSFLWNFIHLVELVHVQLPNERRQMLMSEEIGQHLVLQFLRVLYQDLCAIVCPGDELLVLVFLTRNRSTSRIWCSLKTNSGIAYLYVSISVISLCLGLFKNIYWQPYNQLTYNIFCSISKPLGVGHAVRILLALFELSSVYHSLPPLCFFLNQNSSMLEAIFIWRLNCYTVISNTDRPIQLLLGNFSNNIKSPIPPLDLPLHKIIIKLALKLPIPTPLDPALAMSEIILPLSFITCTINIVIDTITIFFIV